MSKLENAMYEAKIAIEHSDKIVIDRSDNKRKRMNSINNYKENLLNNNSNNDININQSELIQYINDKDDEINNLNEQISIYIERELKFENYIKLLEKKINYYENINQSISTNTTSDNSIFVDNKSDLINLFESLTSMKVQVDTTNSNKYICIIKNTIDKVATKFTIEININANIMTFTPLANVQHLPDYLHNCITFESNMAPVVLSDVLQSLYQDNV